ncbi:RidA family protein [Pelagibacterium sp. 26DY04]|uniref:RidA family protein n=1 Tax=unclassified Pelagibacterium TaxID=2623280 RepID=UPI002814AE3D|nr:MULTISPECIES: RidA family protein [unclassified Pelagibacterium]WMT87856.1 RidA family protein [Pelagibacterium sp. 26DY04]WMT91377.1 RidA family protein [Pelagibacterium sp. H642]
MSIERLHSGPRMSQAVKHGNTLYLAGQVAKDEFATIEEQTAQVLEKIDALLSEAGSTKSKVLSVQVLLSNIADFAAMNSVYDKWIDPANPPARACYEARLASPNLRVEIIAVAALD